MAHKCDDFFVQIVFVVILGDVGGPKWSPPIPGANVKVSFPGVIDFVFCLFKKIVKQIKKCTKMITSCSIRQVGRNLGY